MRFPNFIRELPSEAVSRVIDLLNQPQIVQSVKEAASQVGVNTERGVGQLQDSVRQAKRWIDAVKRRYTAATPPAAVAQINATGRVFVDHLSGPAAVESAAAAVNGVLSGYVDAAAVRKQLHEQIGDLAGGASSLVLHSVPAAIQCLAMHPSLSRGWVASRAAALRLPDGTDVIAMLQRLGHVVEAGTVNRCTSRELDAAIARTAEGKDGKALGLLTMLPTAATAADATDSPLPLEELFLAAAKREAIPAVEVRYDAVVCDLADTVPQAVTVTARLRSGVAAVLVPGEMLLGGPRCGIIVGTPEFVDPLRGLATDFGLYASPLTAAMMLGALAGNQTREAWLASPLGEIWTSSMANQRGRGERLAAQIRMSPLVAGVAVGERSLPVGGQPLDSIQLPSITLQVDPAGSVEALEKRLRDGGRGVLAMREGGKIVVALRTVDPADDQALVGAFGTEDDAADSQSAGDAPASDMSMSADEAG